ncbi:sulfurtransferase complex subunit TusC [Salinivibrio sp. YCSC6]|uniref:sulfurtransferase complex subunit TusC n=1 Tax=Salinivibrio sp. YCSC6 TaxID=2003370 RepID=UPI000BBCD98F|nr:sulfurtransferase complex subunit TusC [Salinivibrio sp. YCSC6]PCE68703.1 sulfurtransferase TusC [Salinivibrio sp. YCSC6]QCF36863.1 sulfurtransferase complex subunit TusC [Salinivibrio sp. YCSC6]
MQLGFVFSTAPHGSASGREGLDALLATSAFCETISVFFIGDGVMQLIDGQRPSAVLSRDYIASFKMLPLCDVEDIYICQASLMARGMGDAARVLTGEVLEREHIQAKLARCDRILHF